MAHEQGAPVEHAGHESRPSPLAASEHAHHAVPAALENAAAVGDSTPPTVLLTASCGGCCLDRQVALVAVPGGQRTDAAAFGAATMLTPMALFLLTTLVREATAPGPPMPPPSPTRAPLVLRI